MSIFLGIDTSNYTTSVALFNHSDFSVKQLKLPLPVKEGEVGLRQNDTVFLHNKSLPILLEELLQDVKIDGIGVSSKPRNVEGSYMPCFTVGFGYAKAISAALHISHNCFSHQEGHIYSALYSANKLDLKNKSFYFFHISGGTTEVLEVHSNQTINIGKTLDISAGQLIDRVGVKMGLPFPSGSYIEELARKSTNHIKPVISVKDNNCNFSGTENKSIKMLQEGISKEDVSLFLINSISATLEKMLQNKEKPIVLAGGVMSNSIIKENLSKYNNVYFAKPEFSSDNAAGLAILAAFKAGVK
jgi:N6-L-threonylcarbamoyladenine synthase